MPQNNYMELYKKRYGERYDAEEIRRKKEAREPHKASQKAQSLKGIKAKIYSKEKFREKIQMQKMIKAHEEKMIDVKIDKPGDGAVPAYLLDRENVNQTKILSNMVKQKRKEKAGKWSVPISKVKAMSEAEMFSVVRSGKRQRKQWKRKVNKVTFVGDNFTRKPPKYERYIRPSGLRFKKAHVTHPELKTTFFLEILAVKKNPQSALYTNLGVITKGAVLEVNISELGLVTQTGKVIWSKYAQVTNNPENDGCINAVLLV
jgi:ribosome biogenesis protein NSA2